LFAFYKREIKSFTRTRHCISIAEYNCYYPCAIERGFLGMVASFLFYLWKDKGRVLVSLFLVFIFLFVALCSHTDKPPFNRYGFKWLVSGEHSSIFSEYRFQRLSMTAHMLKDHPFFGIGLKHFRKRFDEYNPNNDIEVLDDFKIADDMYLTILAETGIVGFLGFLIFIFYLLKRGLRAFHVMLDKRKKELLLVSMSALVGLLVNMGAYELFYWHNPFALFCIISGVIASLSLQRE